MMKEAIAQAEQALLHTYNRYQIVLDRGEGVWLYEIGRASCRERV